MFSTFSSLFLSVALIAQPPAGLPARPSAGDAGAPAAEALSVTASQEPLPEEAPAAGSCAGTHETLTTILRRSPQILAAGAVTDQSAFGVSEARSYRRPQLSAFARAGVGSTLLENGQLDNEAGLRVSYTLFDFRRSRMALDAAELRLDASLAAETLARQEKALEVLSLLNDLLHARALLETFAQRHDTLRQQVVSRRRQLGLGAFTRTELTRLQSDLAMVEVEIAEAEAQAITALSRLQRLYGRDHACFDAENLSAWLDLRSFASLAAAERAALNDGAITRLQNELEAARLDARRISREWLPSIDASAYVAESYNDNLDQFEQRDRVGLQMSMPLFDGGTTRARAGRSDARARQIEAQLTALVDDRLISARVAWKRMQSLEDSLRAASEAIDSAGSHLAAIERTFDLGAATVDDVLEAEERLLSLQVRKASLEHEVRSLEIEFATLLFMSSEDSPE